MLPIECTSDSENQCPPSKNAADSSASGTEAASLSASRSSFADAAAAIPLDKPEISEMSFYVYFSNTPTRHTPDSSELSLAAYKQQECDNIQRAKEVIKSKFINRTIIRLRNVGVADWNCDRLAHLVMEGKEVKFNADKDEPRSTEDIYEYYRHMKEIESYQCLLISAPADEAELKRRREEMRNFCMQAFPMEHFDHERLDHTITYREVDSSAHVRTYVQDFFRRSDGIRAKRAIHAMILFFGHGSSDGGFCAGNQDMPLDDIILFVKQEWRRALWRSPEDLPVKVEIIFTQCYGHLHDQGVQTDRFKVTSFTTADNPLTTSAPDAAGEYANDNLTLYARGPLRDQVLQTEVWRQSDQDKFVDLSAAAQTSRDRPSDNVPGTSTTDDLPTLSSTGC